MDPPDFNFENINIGEILGSLSPEDFEKLSSLASQFTGAEKAQEEPCREETGSGFNIDPDMLFKIMNIMQKLNSRQNDPRCNLITALKPLLSPEKRHKADMAIDLLRLMSLKDIFGAE